MKYVRFAIIYALIIFGFAGSIIFIPKFAELVGNFIAPATKWLIKGVFANFTPTMILQFFMLLLFMTLPAVLAGLLFVIYDNTDNKWFIVLFVIACIGVIVFDVYFYKHFKFLFDAVIKYKYDGPTGLEALFDYWFGQIKIFFKNLAGRTLVYCYPVIGQLAGAFIYGLICTEDDPGRVIKTILYPILLVGAFLLVIALANFLSFLGTVLAIVLIIVMCLGYFKIAGSLDDVVLDNGTKISGSGSTYYDSSGNSYTRDGDRFRKN